MLPAGAERGAEVTAGTTRLGPLVHRSVHHAAALWLLASLQFIVAMVVVQLAWTGHPAYSLANNYISDLGNTHCGPWPSATSPDICSPWHDVFNGSVIALGVLVVLGSILVRTGFPPRRSSAIGLWGVALAGIGAIGVGVSPENVNGTVHAIASLVAFAIGSLALIVLGFAMFRDTRWDGFRAYTLFSGLLSFVATILFSVGVDVGLGVGGMERLIVAPLLLWLIVAPIHLLRIPQYAPHALPSPGGR
jgi:hypothetical membrane protein